MEYKLKTNNQGEVEITVTVLTKDLRTYLLAVAKKLAQRREIPGFRPGFAPYEVVKEKVGENKILNQAAELAIQKTYSAIILKENLETIGQPQVTILKLEQDSDFTYQAIAPLLPSVEIKSLAKISVKAQTPVVTIEDIEKVIKEIQASQAKEKLVLRPAQKGDKVMINFEVFLNKVPLAGGKQNKYPLLLGENRFLPGFEEQIFGLSAGASKEFSLPFPANYWQQDLAGKTGEFKVKVLEVFTRELPEITDDWASHQGSFKNLQDLKERIKKTIWRENQRKEVERQESQILEEIIKSAKFSSFSPRLLSSEVQRLLEELKVSLENQGLNFADYLAHLKKTIKELELDFLPEAVRRLKKALVLKQLAKEKEISVSEKDLESEIQQAKKQYAQNSEILEKLESPDYKDFLRQVLGNRKVLAWLRKELVRE